LTSRSTGGCSPYDFEILLREMAVMIFPGRVLRI
jgi:hypothetical protein